MKKIAYPILALSLFTALPVFAADPVTLAPVPDAIANHQGQIKIAVIRNLGSDDNTTQFLSGVLKEGKKLGFKVDTFLSNGDDARFQDFVNQAISQKYDGIILSQGRAPYSTELVKRITDNGIAVSVFDTAIQGEIPGLTVTQQDDASLTNESFGQLIKDFDGNANKVGAVLAKYPKGKIDAIWGTWDAFTQGAYKALQENGRTEIKLYSIDISNQDLQLMREANSPWKVSVAIDPKLIGAINLRLIAKKIAGETTPASYEFRAASIPQALLASQPGPVNVAGLSKIIPGWGQSDDFNSPWFATLAAQNGQ
ncbi:ABC-type sugar transport system, periplasmic component [Yersinia pseudotuberculosis]|nr:ABC-type sugar transport system, periplasmic component [Yersinia pseudotuberculosis]